MALPLPINPQPATAPRYGLIVSSDPPFDNSDRWMQGLSYSPEGCGSGVAVDPCISGTNVFDPNNRPAKVEWLPYNLIVNEDCSLLPSGDDREARVTRKLSQSQETLIGHELWTGDIASVATTDSFHDANGDPTSLQSLPWPNTWLAHNADAEILSPPGQAVGLVHGLACLEQYLAANGGDQGMIHATAQVVTHWASFRLLRREGNKLLTMLDTIVVASPGYSGTGPHGQIADNDIWAYATDPVYVRLGPVKVEGQGGVAVDYRNNNQVVVAQRPALAEWNKCRHAGVQLAVTLCGSGIGS